MVKKKRSKLQKKHWTKPLYRSNWQRQDSFRPMVGYGVKQWQNQVFTVITTVITDQLAQRFAVN
jgi:hypothetical protein